MVRFAPLLALLLLPACPVDGDPKSIDESTSGTGEGSSGSTTMQVVVDPVACEDNAGCPPEGYCAKALGDCGGSGICMVRPPGAVACNLVRGAGDAACGCDGLIYTQVADGVACAAANGESTDCKGACPCDNATGG